MKELKVILATPHPKMKNACDGAIEVYIKSEADKVIADLEESHKMEVEQLLIEIVKLKEGAKNLILDNYLKDKEIRRHKYKRCLDKAKWCEAEVRNIRRTPFCDMSEHEGWQHDDDFWQRWRKRWLELAEQFKVAK